MYRTVLVLVPLCVIDNFCNANTSNIHNPWELHGMKVLSNPLLKWRTRNK